MFVYLQIITWPGIIFTPYSPRAKTHEQMLDDQDDLHSTHSIGIVENPLYAEQEDYNTPSYATLKEKEAEVRVLFLNSILWQ